MKGFTLIETLVYCALFSMLFTGIFTSVSLIQSSSLDTKRELHELEEAIYREDQLTASSNSPLP